MPNNKVQMPEHIRKMFEERERQKQQNSLNQEATNDEPQPIAKEDENASLNQVEEQIETKTNKNKNENKKTKDKKEKQKPIKDKKEKPIKVKKPSRISKKNKIIISLVTSLVVVVGVVVTSLVLHNAAISKKMETPVLSVIDTSSGVILSVDENERAVKYEFNIKKQGDFLQKSINSNKNELKPLKSYMELPGTYIITARYIGVNDSATSLYSNEFVFNKYEKLATPILTKKEDSLVWAQVPNATAYKIYYTLKDGSLGEIEETASSLNTQTFSLSKINERGTGAYKIYVAAVGQEGYLTSELSKPVEYSYMQSLDKPTSLNFDASTNILTVNVKSGTAKIKSLIIKINDKMTVMYDIDNVASSYEIALGPLINGVILKKISVSCVGDNIYTINSPFTEITL